MTNFENEMITSTTAMDTIKLSNISSIGPISWRAYMTQLLKWEKFIKDGHSQSFLKYKYVAWVYWVSTHHLLPQAQMLS
jgi:hypothetical protein